MIVFRVLCVFLAALSTGCVTKITHRSFKEAGEPPSRKAIMLIDGNPGSLDKIKIDGQSVTFAPVAFLRVVEMLEGKRTVEARVYGRDKVECSFDAKPGETYTLGYDEAFHDHGPGSTSYTKQMVSAWIAKLPQEKSQNISMRQRISNAPCEYNEKKNLEKVAYFRQK